MSHPPQTPRALGQAGCRVFAWTLDRRPAPDLLPLPPAFSPPPSLGKRPYELTPKEYLHILRFPNQTDNSRPPEFHGQGRCPKPSAAILYFPLARPSASWGFLHIPAQSLNPGSRPQTGVRS